MTHARDEQRAQYAKTRSEFEKLNTQDKTAFVVEATFATVGRAVEDAGRQLADVLERVANYDFEAARTKADARDPAANPAEPPASASRTSAATGTPKPKRSDENADESDND